MRICILSDLHISRNTPWGRDWEDVSFLINELNRLYAGGKIPEFDAALICGDTFNSPRIYQGDVVKFFAILRALRLESKPIGWINGNHDPGAFHALQAKNNDVQNLLMGTPSYDPLQYSGAVNLDVYPFLGIAGHSYSQNLDVIRDWLKYTQNQITVTHQSASMFMKLDGLELEQLRPEDFHAPLNIIGDTHVTSVWQKDGVICLSPGILCPMRSRMEMQTSDPRLVWMEADYLGDGKFDLENAAIESMEIRKRPHIFINTNHCIDACRCVVESREKGDPPVIAFVDRGACPDFEVDDTLNIRMISYIKGIESIEDAEDVSFELGESVTVNTMVSAAEKLIPENSTDRGTTLSLVKDLLSADSPTDIAKNYLEG